MNRLEEIKDVLVKKDKRYAQKDSYQLFDYIILEEMLQEPVDVFLDYIPSLEEMDFYHKELSFLATYYRIDFSISHDLPYLRRIADQYRKDHRQEEMGNYHYVVSFDDVKCQYPSMKYQGKPYGIEDFSNMLKQGVEYSASSNKTYKK